MFKRVKSLVLAGALVLGMAVPAFAETPLEKVTTNYLNNMSGVGSYDAGAKTRTITKEDYISDEEWETFIKGINEEEGASNRLVITAYGAGRTEYKVYFDANYDNVLNESDELLIETINIEINNDDVNGKGIIDIISPETGDMIAYGGLTIAAIAGAGLYISNKKRK